MSDENPQLIFFEVTPEGFHVRLFVHSYYGAQLCCDGVFVRHLEGRPAEMAALLRRVADTLDAYVAKEKDHHVG